MEFLNTIKNAFNPIEAIDRIESATVTALNYVQPESVSKNLVSLARAQAEFSRSTVEAAKTFSAVAVSVNEKFAKSFQQAAK